MFMCYKNLPTNPLLGLLRQSGEGLSRPFNTTRQTWRLHLSTDNEPWLNGFPFNQNEGLFPQRNSEPTRALKTWANPARV